MTQYVLWMLICFLITLVVVLAASKRLTIIPTNKFTNMVEYGYEFVKKDMGESAIGHGYKKHLPFLATLFFFILISNFVGLIPGCKTPTGSISITWALAAISFIYFIFWGIKAKGLGGYLKSFAPSGPGTETRSSAAGAYTDSTPLSLRSITLVRVRIAEMADLTESMRFSMLPTLSEKRPNSALTSPKSRHTSALFCSMASVLKPI